MATLSALTTSTRRALGTSDSGYFTDTLIADALDRAQLEIVEQYEVEDMIRETTIAFTSGVGALPSDYLRRVFPETDGMNGSVGRDGRDLWNDSADEDYNRVSVARFDKDVDLTWTVSTLGGTKQVQIFEADTVTLNIRYLKQPASLTASVDSGLPSYYDRAHTLLAAFIMLDERREIEAARILRIQYDEQINLAQVTDFKEMGQASQSSADRAVDKANLGDNIFTL